MNIPQSVAPIATLLAVGGLVAATPSPAHAVTSVTVKVTGVQTYGGSPVFTGTTGVAGVTATGMTCTSLSDGTPIAPTVAALGTYTIDGATCSGGVLSKPDYAIAGYTGLKLTVNRAALTVAADNKTKSFGDPNPPLTSTTTGFVNGEDASVLTGAPNLFTSVTTSTAPGDYAIGITKGGLTAANYTFTLVPGTMSVRQSPVSVSVTGAQSYGAAPVFTATTNVAGVTATGVSCTRLSDGRDIAPTLPVGTAYAIDPASCSGAVLSNPSLEVGSYQSVKFSVAKAALTVTADDASRSFGAANPALGYTVTGFQNGEDGSVLTGSPNLSTIATTSSDVGSYQITTNKGSLTSPNYSFILVPGTLTVVPKPVTVTVSGTQTYGGAPDFVGTTGTAGVTASGVSCTALADGTAIAPTLPVAADYAIDPASCSGATLSSTNYAVDGYAAKSFAVAKATLTVTATDTSRTYGFANPPLGYTFSGFQNGDDASDVSGAPALATSAVVRSNVGTFPITISGGTLSAADYKFVLVPGTMTVLKKQIVVKADPATRAYGETNPAFTATYTGFRNGDTSAVFTGTPAFSTTATATSDPGSYPVTIAQGPLDAQNYSFIGFASGSSTLTVTQAAAKLTTTRMNAGVLSATVTYGTANNPVVGSTITFTVGSGTTVACTAVTDVNGKATCTAPNLTRTPILLGGYTAHFDGTAGVAAGEKHQGPLL
ncbi:MBG domain-containing protein [Nocardioides sp. MH1]|uniref:MBG domain-containing protein n=1 Tax=Nocardioides sp. MH1 TaxID=3242490 RepID=UPI003521D165